MLSCHIGYKRLGYFWQYAYIYPTDVIVNDIFGIKENSILHFSLSVVPSTFIFIFILSSSDLDHGC